MAEEIFVHLSCPHCASVIERYGGAPLRDITDIRTLKQFLAYRDQLGGFAEVKAAGKIGVPSKVIDGAAVEFFDEV